MGPVSLKSVFMEDETLDEDASDQSYYSDAELANDDALIAFCTCCGYNAIPLCCDCGEGRRELARCCDDAFATCPMILNCICLRTKMREKDWEMVQLRADDEE